MNPGKRKFLLSLGGIGIAGVLPKKLPAFEGDNGRAIARTLIRIFYRQESARLIGREYLRERPEETGFEKLAELIDAIAKASQYPVFKRKKLIDSFLAQQRDDFKQERVVYLYGWILSETEARLCAISLYV